jgi:hypothetical protein
MELVFFTSGQTQAQSYRYGRLTASHHKIPLISARVASPVVHVSNNSIPTNKKTAISH